VSTRQAVRDARERLRWHDDHASQRWLPLVFAPWSRLLWASAPRPPAITLGQEVVQALDRGTVAQF
jgi:hypothetical protein